MRNRPTSRIHPRWVAVAIALALVAALPAAASVATSAADPASAPVAPASPATVLVASTAPVYSTPAWFPFRTDMRISCVLSNCKYSSGADNHGYWAMDF